MKLFNIATIVGLTAATVVSSRVRRDVSYRLSGEENSDDLMNILTEISSMIKISMRPQNLQQKFDTKF